MKHLMLFTFLILLFSSCGTTNKKSSIVGKPLKLSDANFQEKILENNKVSVVYFWATWCGPCKITGPVIEDLAKEQVGNATFGKVNVDRCKNVTAKYGIVSIPSVLIIKNGAVVDQHVGGFSSSTIRGMIKKHS